jgi:GAF domain/ANTAR domain
VDPEVLERILEGLANDRVAGRGSGARLLNACVEILDVTGAGITLMVDDEHRGTLGGTDEAIRAVEELQFTLGEGPCIDTYRTGRPVLEPHLAHPEVARWPEFATAAVEAGIQAIFGFPLQIGAIRIGALDFYCDQPGSLRKEQFTDALIVADVVAHALIDLQAGAAPGALAAELQEGTRLRMVVHQASGMLSVQLEIPVRDALSRLRAYAYAENRPINDVARAVVDRRLRIE